MSLRYQYAVKDSPAKNGVADSSEAICGLLWLARDEHSGRAWPAELPPFSDGLGTFTGDHAASLAESLRNYARSVAGAHRHNAKEARGREEAATAEDLEVAASRSRSSPTCWHTSSRFGSFRARK